MTLSRNARFELGEVACFLVSLTLFGSMKEDTASLFLGGTILFAAGGILSGIGRRNQSDVRRGIKLLIGVGLITGPIIGMLLAAPAEAELPQGFFIASLMGILMGCYTLMDSQLP